MRYPVRIELANSDPLATLLNRGVLNHNSEVRFKHRMHLSLVKPKNTSS